MNKSLTQIDKTPPVVRSNMANAAALNAPHEQRARLVA
jgi:hypothetical protein